jgi:RNA polymerase sigma-70 factor (ECF subfamily)
VITALRAPRRPAPTLDTDLAVAEAAAAGDAAAFAELYARYADRVFARITHLIGPGSDREDVVQQVFLELHRALPRFRGDSTVSTFLYRITINVAYDHLRRRARRSADHDPAALDALIDGDLTPEDRTRRREQLVQIFALLERLKPKKRIAFVLVAVEGLSLGEAAELIDATPDAVKQRVLHARRELLALMTAAERAADRRPS